MEREVYPLISKALRARTLGWANPVDFDYLRFITEASIRVHVYPTGGGAKYWGWVSRGVHGHPIRPRRKFSLIGRGKGRRRAALRLYHYQPFTRPGNFYGGAGTRSFGGWVSHVPWWPGIDPRLFEESVVLELKGEYQRLMENIVRRAVKAAQREGK